MIAYHSSFLRMSFYPIYFFHVLLLFLLIDLKLFLKFCIIVFVDFVRASVHAQSCPTLRPRGL